MENLKQGLKPIIALCKRRGFIYPGSEIYGGFANTYSFGPYGAELKKNIKDLWWKKFVRERRDMVGLDGPILLHPNVWKASGHVNSFNDALIDCKKCKARFRVDHLLEEALNIKAEGLSLKDLSNLVIENKIKCPVCGSQEFTEARYFNLMFQTQMNKTSTEGQEENIAFLRPETAQAIFLDFKNIIDTNRVKIPFGIAQIGKAFRNEITPGNFIFRTIEFEQMEIEYFIKEAEWEKTFENWLNDMLAWCKLIGLNASHLSIKEHDEKELAHYSKRTVDILFTFPFGTSELYGLAYRTDFDLKSHSSFSKNNLEYLTQEERFIPHVIEPSFGVERTILALLCDAYREEKLENGEMRVLLKFSPTIAPVKAAIFPLIKKEELIKKALDVFEPVKKIWNVEYDESGTIGKRYRRQDELGTPYCLTIDFQTLEDGTVTIRDRDTMQQKRAPIDSLKKILSEELLPSI